jgi:plastocyanin domain-containing protein
MMLKRSIFWGTLAGFGFLLGAISGVLAGEMPADHTMPSDTTTSTQFRRIDQPLSNKVAVTLGGLGLMGLELWWFLLSKPKSQKATAREGIQDVSIAVDGGYEPSRIVVKAGQPVRLNFLRRDPSSCLEEVRLPDFRIAQLLPLNQVITVEFTPSKPGSYEFTCGMNMFRGTIQVEA